MKDPHQATVWTARACAFLWLLSLAVANRSGREAASRRRWQVVWSAAGILLGIHILVAFHFEHAWSHAAAYRHTARQTADTIGLNWGGGLYFNYAVVAMWLADIFMLWSGRDAWRQSRTKRAIVDWFVTFMMVNATVVFGPWGWKPLGVIVGVGLFLTFRQREQRQAEHDDR